MRNRKTFPTVSKIEVLTPISFVNFIWIQINNTIKYCFIEILIIFLPPTIK
jgi:hypothetical protein